jgi:hypothetical protein
MPGVHKRRAAALNINKVKMKIKQTLKFIGTLISIVLTRIIGYVILGIIINIIIVYSQWDIISNIFAEDQRAVDSIWKSYLVLTGCLIMPVFYYVVGQKQGLMASLSFIIRKQKINVLTYIFTNFCTKHPDVLESKSEISQSTIEKFNKVSNFLDKLPFIVQWILNSLISKLSLASNFASVIASGNNESTDNEKNISRICSIVSESIPEDILAPSFKIPMCLVGANILLVFL